MDEKEIELKKLELERSHQCSIELGRGAKGVMTWKAKFYFTDEKEQNIVQRASSIKTKLDVLTEFTPEVKD